MRIAIVGTGRMGTAVATVAESRGHEIVAQIGREENGDGLTRAQLGNPDVVVEFTRPEAVETNLRRLLALDLPVVTGTTGWLDHLPEVTRVVMERSGALLHAVNFSIGVQLFLRAAETLATAARGLDTFDAAITETHHTAKRDAPSGTALDLQARLRNCDPDRAFPITALRLGAVPGTHQLLYDGLAESITLTHTARDRSIFAEGAVRAAEWLPGHPGVHTFADMLFGGSS